MELDPIIILRSNTLEQITAQKRMYRELCQIAELRQRFNITSPHLLARAMRLPESSIRKLLENRF